MDRKPRRRAPQREPRRKAVAPEKKDVKLPVEFKIFGRWDSNITVSDASLKNYINVFPRHLPRSAGTNRERFGKSKAHIIERLALHLIVSGHSGKKHKLSSGRFGGGYATVMRQVENALEIIEQKEKKNPVEVLVQAVVNAAVREEIVSFQVGSVVVRESVVTAPQRRIDKALRAFAHAAYKKAFNKPITLGAALAEELIAAAANSSQSMAIQERERIEREATGAR